MNICVECEMQIIGMPLTYQKRCLECHLKVMEIIKKHESL